MQLPGERKPIKGEFDFDALPLRKEPPTCEPLPEPYLFLITYFIMRCLLSAAGCGLFACWEPETSDSAHDTNEQHIYFTSKNLTQKSRGQT